MIATKFSVRQDTLPRGSRGRRGDNNSDKVSTDERASTVYSVCLFEVSLHAEARSFQHGQHTILLTSMQKLTGKRPIIRDVASYRGIPHIPGKLLKFCVRWRNFPGVNLRKIAETR